MHQGIFDAKEFQIFLFVFFTVHRCTIAYGKLLAGALFTTSFTLQGPLSDVSQSTAPAGQSDGVRQILDLDDSLTAVRVLG
jgi:hypothetical protein